MRVILMKNYDKYNDENSGKLFCENHVQIRTVPEITIQTKKVVDDIVGL